MLHDIVEVEILEPYRVRLRFDDGVEGVVDLDRQVHQGGVFEPLLEPAYFRLVRVEPDLGTIVWPNGADLDPAVLYSAITGAPLPGAGISEE